MNVFVGSLEQLEAYFLARDIEDAMKELDSQPKQLQAPPMRERTPEELKAFDDGFTSAICVLHSRGYEDAALELLKASEDIDVTVNLDIVRAYVGVSLG